MLAQIEDSFLEEIRGEKGGMVLVDDAEMDEILQKINKDNVEISPGGAAANTIFGAANLGLKSAFLGKLGRDENSHFYTDSFKEIGGNTEHFKYTHNLSTGRCLSLITPDAERTMRTNLSAASELEVDDITVDDFKDTRHVHIEGYLLFKPDLLESTLHKIKEAECTISLDLGSFEVVQAAKENLPHILKDYVTIVLANEEEAEALCGHGNEMDNLNALAQMCPVACLKLGSRGAILKRGDEVATVKPVTVSSAIDTTGAGDLWASGFLYGYLSGLDLEKSGRIASILGAHAVSCIGTCFDSDKWDTIRETIKTL